MKLLGIGKKWQKVGLGRSVIGTRIPRLDSEEGLGKFSVDLVRKRGSDSIMIRLFDGARMFF